MLGGVRSVNGARSRAGNVEQGDEAHLLPGRAKLLPDLECDETSETMTRQEVWPLGLDAPDRAQVKGCDAFQRLECGGVLFDGRHDQPEDRLLGFHAGNEMVHQDEARFHDEDRWPRTGRLGP